MMRKIEKSREFRHVMKRIESGGHYRRIIKERLAPALIALANDEELDYTYHDHPLIGNWEGFRECHLSFDLLLVYRYEGDDVLWLEKIGSHSEVLGL